MDCELLTVANSRDGGSPGKAAMIHPAFLPSSTGTSRRRSGTPCYWEPDAQELGSLAAQDFEIIRVLGVGTYGVVKLAKHVPSGASVALKVLSKEHVVATRQEKHILRERAVHLELQHAFVARLYGTFQDADCLYLVLEYLPGGELWSLVYSQPEDDGETPQTTTYSEALDREDERKTVTSSHAEGDNHSEQQSVFRPASLSSDSVSASCELGKAAQGRLLDAHNLAVLRSGYGGLEETHVIFYLGCILCALEYLHGEGLLYRDLKLENLVLDRQGYLKMLDFGFAKPDALRASTSDGSDKPRNLTLCGSMDYMAPEVLLREAHDQRVDVWSFGIIMYELLVGKTPFYHDNPRELGRRITTEAVSFPEGFEEQHPLACELLAQLLVKNPSARLGSMQEVKTHAFFSRTFEDTGAWERLTRRELTPPFVPKLSGPFDTSFFQTIDDEEQDELDDDVEPYFEDGSHVFRDF